MSDDFPEFPEILRREIPQAPPSKSESVVMTSNTDVDTEVAAPAPEAPAKVKAKAKPKVKAKANGNGATHKAATPKVAAPKVKAKAKTKEAARAPRTRDPAKLDEFGFRKDSIKSKAAVLYKKGATLAQVKEVVGSIQFNVLNELEEAGFKVNKTEVKGKGGRTATKYQVVAKGK